MRQWKLSPIDLESLDKWDDYSQAKEAMILRTDTEWAPWTTVKSNDKKRARINAMRAFLARFEYDGKDLDVVGEPDPRIVSAAPTPSGTDKAMGQGCWPRSASIPDHRPPAVAETTGRLRTTQSP